MSVAPVACSIAPAPPTGEALGALEGALDGTFDRPGDPRADIKPGTADALDTKGAVDGYTDDGRWRFSQYVGWVGNFIHLFVTDPVEHVGHLASERFRAGRSKIHAHIDG